MLAGAVHRAVGGLSCAELIIEDERAWQFISSHTEALLTTESEDRRIHLFNFCFKKQTSNETTEKKEEMLWCNKMSFFFFFLNTLAAAFVFCRWLRKTGVGFLVVVFNSRELNVFSQDQLLIG